MAFERLAEGSIVEVHEDELLPVAACSRCAVTGGDEVVCTYVRSSALGINDFVPMICWSSDGGITWAGHRPMWPELSDSFSIIGSVSRSPAGWLCFYGTRTAIDEPGESFWCEATQGLKTNELIWAESSDGGRSWSAPRSIPMLIPGSAEAPGAMCITASGRMLGPYVPYPTFDPALRVDRSQIAGALSDDRVSWRYSEVQRFQDPESVGAESWIVELSDRTLLSTSWNSSAKHGDYPNQYSLSFDAGTTWSAAKSTEVMGQSTALAALPNGKALFIYNQRKQGEPGVWMAVVKPSEADFGIEANEIIWAGGKGTQSDSSGEHSDWRDFSFGEPSVTVLRDGTLLVALWCIQPTSRGIRYVKLRMRH